MSETPLVLVTGVSGFIASWVAHIALKVGYRVRGTVRSLKNEDKIKHLRDLCPGSRYTIELVEADLTSDAGWDEAVTGVHYILHVASPFIVGEPKDPNDLIKPAVEGTLRVLQAAARQETLPRRVVLTSSVAAISSGHSKLDFSPADWTDLSNPEVSSYTRSKTLAERAAWDFVDKLEQQTGRVLELCTVNPSVVLGPLLSANACASADIITKIMLRQYPALPNVRFQVVSVLDVARAHVLAMTAQTAHRQRFILSATNCGIQPLSAILDKHFRPLGFRPLTFAVPDFLLHVFAFFGDREAKSSAPLLGRDETLDTSATAQVLGLTCDGSAEAVEGMVVQMTKGLIAAGLIKDRSPGQAITAEYQRPECDVSMIPTPELL